MQRSPEEDVWLAKQKSRRTRVAYKQDVGYFMRTIGIASQNELRQVDHRALIARERYMRETEKAAPSTVLPLIGRIATLEKRGQESR